jgi:hypothetical protein
VVLDCLHFIVINSVQLCLGLHVKFAAREGGVALKLQQGGVNTKTFCTRRKLNIIQNCATIFMDGLLGVNLEESD